MKTARCLQEVDRSAMKRKSGSIIVRAGRIFTPESGFIERKALVVRDGVIEGIADRPDAVGVDNAVDLSSSTISPPFCDHHLHFPSDDPDEIDAMAEALIARGITAAVDGGSRRAAGLAARKALEGKIDVRTPGFALFKAGGYGGYIGRGVRDMREARSLIDELISMNVDFIKVINSGVFDPATGGITNGGFERRELEEIAGYANDRGLAVTCHANGDERIRDAVMAGASAIVHGFYVSEETLRMMKERDVAFIPTVNALNSLKKTVQDEKDSDAIDRLVGQHLSAIRKAYYIGVRILAGSDAGPSIIPFGSSFLEELGLFSKAGLSTEQILISALAATFEPGAKADFLVLREHIPVRVCSVLQTVVSHDVPHLL